VCLPPHQLNQGDLFHHLRCLQRGTRTLKVPFRRTTGSFSHVFTTVESHRALRQSQWPYTSVTSSYCTLTAMRSRGRGVTIPTHSPCAHGCVRSQTCHHSVKHVRRSLPVLPVGARDFHHVSIIQLGLYLNQPLPKPGWLRSTYAGQDIWFRSPLPVHCVQYFHSSGRGYFSLAVCPSTSCAGALHVYPTGHLTQGRSKKSKLRNALPPLFIHRDLLETHIPVFCLCCRSTCC